MITDFLNLLERLVHHGVDFVIVGGFAGVAHGCTYVTQDIDICCDCSPSNLLALQMAVSDLEPMHRMKPRRKKLELTEETCGQFKNLYLDTKGGQLACLSLIDGLGDFSRAKLESELIEVEGARMRVLSLDALIRTKRAMNRPRDKEAISQLEAIKELRERPERPVG
ncbi:MAG: nucleotidyltransferase [Planctomycetota bacterium]